MNGLIKPTIFGVDARHFFRIASPLTGAVITGIGALIRIARPGPLGDSILVVGASWTVVTGVGSAAQAFREADEQGAVRPPQENGTAPRR